jgi:hypothetical protein
METLVAPACAGRNLRNLQLWECQEEACLTLCLDWRALCIQVGLLTWLLALVTIQLALTHHAVWKVQPLHIHTSVSFLSSKSLSPQPFMQLRKEQAVWTRHHQTLWLQQSATLFLSRSRGFKTNDSEPPVEWGT